MTPEQWGRAKEIFDAALELPSSTRSAYVQSICSGDSTIFTEVQNLLAAHEEMSSGAFRPDWFPPAKPPEPSLRNGEVISGRFRIIRRLGKGGMGEVYEAHDVELGVQVALKTLHPGIAANPDVLNRFRQEVRIAHLITHFNVCRTFHLGRDTAHISSDGSGPVDLTFITMEVLDGENLQQMLKSTGRMPLDRAHAIAIQMADAIEASHDAGIIHRDIKPGNVMICSGRNGERDRVAVTDFGLAKVDTSAPGSDSDLSAISHPGHIIGTPAYMAPEQLSLRPVSPATDIYAFGLVLYEMVTGQKAFPDSNTIEDASPRLTEEPPSPRAVFPTLPAAWDRAILCCLQIDPAYRLQHATDVIAVLEGANPAALRKSAVSHHSSRSKRLPTPRRSNTGRRWGVTFAVIFLFCVSLSWPVYRLYQWRANSTVAPGTLVYLAPVKNETGEKQLDNITELVQAGLSQSAHIHLLDGGKVGDILQSMAKPADTVITDPIAREIAMRAGVRRTILASVTRSSENYILDVEIQETDSTPLRYRNHWQNSFTWRTSNATANTNTISPGLLSAVRNTSDWIRHKVGESEQDVAQFAIPPENATTANWQALTSYRVAQKLLAQGRKEDAIVQLQDAITQDPEFARAHADLADNLISVGRRQEGYQEYINALNSNAGERLSRKERDFIKGTFATDTRDYSTALAAFRDYSAFYENDFDAWFYQAYPLDLLDRPADAIRALQHANSLGSTPNMAAGQLAYSYMLLGDYASARTWIAELVHGKHLLLGDTLSGIEAFLSGNYDESLQSFQRNQQSTVYDYRIIGFYLGARLLAEQGRYADALKTASGGLDALAYVPDTANDRGVQLLDRASIQCHIGNFSGCIDDLIESSRVNKTPDAMLLASTIAGNAFLHLSPLDRRRVQALLESMERALPDDSLGLVYPLARARLHGELALMRGDTDTALIAFRKADALDAPLSAREYLARALLTAASRDLKTSAALKREALRIYARTALRPASVWRQAWYYPPGFVSDQMASYLNLARSLGQNDSETQAVQRALSKLRGSSPPGVVLSTHGKPGH